MNWIDAQPSAIRELINEHGLNVVQAFLQIGVTKPKHIRHLIDTVCRGSAWYGNARGINTGYRICSACDGKGQIKT